MMKHRVKLAALALACSGMLTASVPAHAEQSEIFRIIYQAKKAIHNADKANAPEKEPYAYELARQYLAYSLHEEKDSDSASHEIFAKKALDYAQKAKLKADKGTFIVYNREYIVPENTPQNVLRYRQDLERLELDFYQFRPQYSKYSHAELAAEARLNLERANELIKEATKPVEIEAALRDARASIEKLSAFRVSTIEFDTGKASLKNTSDRVLEKAYMTLQETPWTTVSIEGHTDNEGTNEQNQALSQNRAATVRDWLIKKGIPASRLSTKGFGETKPLATNDTEEGKATNRRIEFKNTGKLYGDSGKATVKKKK